MHTYKRYIIALIIIAGCVAYANVVGGKFIWDDDLLVKKNLYVRDFSYLPQIFTKGIDASEGMRYQFYRPIQILIYAVGHYLWGFSPVGYHLVSILLHILAALGVYALARALSATPLLAGLAALFFTVHPIQTEAVSYIAGMADPLATVFFLLAYNIYIRYPKARPEASGNVSRLLRSTLLIFVLAAAYAVALFSRENTLILPVLLILYHIVFRKKVALLPFVAVVIVAAAYLVVRTDLIPFVAPHRYITTTVLQRLPGFFAAFAEYLRLLVAPIDLHMEYGMKFFSWADPAVIAGAVALLALLVACVRQRTADPLLAFSIGWFLVTLLPHSNIYPLTAYMAEHWLYLPSVGACMAAAIIITRAAAVPALRSAVTVVTVALLCGAAALTMAQNGYWKEPIAFYERTIRFSPSNAKLYNVLGLEYEAAGKIEKALAAFHTAVEIDPKFVGAYNNIALAYNFAGRPAEAVEACEKALEIDPKFGAAYNNLGIAYHQLGRKEEAVAIFAKAVSCDPRNPFFYNSLGNAFGDIGKTDDAIAAYRKAIEINPYYADAYVNLSITYFERKEYARAIAACDKARALGYAVDPRFLKGLAPYRTEQ